MIQRIAPTSPPSSAPCLARSSSGRQARRAACPRLPRKETDALLALDRAVLHCATTLNARMRADGQEPEDWDYTRTIHDRAEGTEPT